MNLDPKKLRRIEGVLRFGLAFPFVYAAMAAYFSPDDWVGFFPDFVGKILPIMLVLNLFGLTQLIISIWILAGKNIFWPSLIAALMLLGIIVTDWAGFQVTFRDVSILAIAIVLMIIHWPEKKMPREQSL